MGVIRWPGFLGGAPRPDREPAPNWDNETRSMQGVGEWLAQLDTDEQKFRVLAYWMWRLKSKDSPKIENWVDSVAEQSAEIIGARTGFGERHD